MSKKSRGRGAARTDDRRKAGGGRANPEQDGSEASEERGTLARWGEQIGTLAIAVLIALTIRALVIEPFRIPSGSMLPTLLIGDHLFVNKFVYGARIPFTHVRLPSLREPARGDVVVFAVARDGPRIVPADRRPDLPRDDFVKRIVGLPGDRVEVRDGRVFVNGERVDEVDTGDFFVDEYDRKLAVENELLQDCVHAVLDDPGRPGLAQAPFVVPEGRYFMLGDNRDHSRDSRDWGTVAFDDFKGPAFILYWSWDVKGNFLEFLNPVNWWSAEKRWRRIFRRVKCEPPETLGAGSGSHGDASRAS